jgi:hypothetical protein
MATTFQEAKLADTDVLLAVWAPCTPCRRVVVLLPAGATPHSQRAVSRGRVEGQAPPESPPTACRVPA